MKCDRCPNDAAYHLTEVVSGRPVTRHLCLSCGKDQVPKRSEMPSAIATAKLSAEALRCSRCSAPTTVVVYAHAEDGPDRSVKYFRSRLALCSECAAADGVIYTPAPTDHVAIVTQA